MEDFRIPYSRFEGRDDFNSIAREILEMPGLAVADISFPKLIKDEIAFREKLLDWSGSSVFGNGVYVFRKFNEGIHHPIYVGQAPDEFLKRIFQHLDTRPKRGYGFNAMLQYIARDVLKIYDDQNGLQEARDWIQDGGSLILVDMEGAESMSLSYRQWEGRLIRAMYAVTHKPEWMQQWPKSREKLLQKNKHLGLQ